MISTIQPNELSQIKTDGESVDLIDVRTPVEFAGLHAKGAVNHPLDTLDPAAIWHARQGASDKPLYLICQMGGRSMRACELFVSAGYDNVVNVTGGTILWERQGLPVVRGKKQVMAMDRQVRIAAGLLVLVGCALALMVQPSWIGIALGAAIGGGLIFSGATDTCGMAAVLAKMPWNRVSGSGNC